MSKIYAPVNSVTSKRRISTNIPADIQLTSEQVREVLQLEYDYANSMLSEVKLAKKFEVINTKNAGIHFFCLENNFALLHLAKNHNIDTLVAMLINHRLNLLDKQSEKGLVRKPYSERYALLTNPAILGNLELFKTIFDSTKEEDKGTIVSTLIFNMQDADVEVLVYIIAWVAEADKPRMLKYVDVLKKREAEIEEWAVANDHMIAGLPTSWILAMYGISEF